MTDRYVAASGGVASGTGGINAPWTLAHALGGAGGTLAVGDTVYLRGGDYTLGFPTSTSVSSVTLQNYGTEEPVLDGAIRLNGANVVLQGLVFANTDSSHTDLMTIDCENRNETIRACTIRGSQGNGIGVWGNAPNSVVEGCILYNNGWLGAAGGGGYGHAVYMQGAASPNTSTIRNCLIFNNYAYPIHCYTEGGNLDGLAIENNVVWNNGWPSAHNRPILIGGSQPATRVSVKGNWVFFSEDSPWLGQAQAVELGYAVDGNGSLDYWDNVAWGGSPALNFAQSWNTASVQSNIVGTWLTGGLYDVLYTDSGDTGFTLWSKNTIYAPSTGNYFSARGSGRSWVGWKNITGLGGTDVQTPTQPAAGQWAAVHVDPAGNRGHAVVFKWGAGSTATIDLTSFNTLVSVRPAHSHRSSIATGTGVVTVSVADVIPPTPLSGWDVTPPVIGPRFGVFLIVADSQAESGSTMTAGTGQAHVRNDWVSAEWVTPLAVT